MAQDPTQTYFETPKQLADRVGIPVSNIRFLIRSSKIEHLYTSPGRRNPKIPVGAWDRYVQQSLVEPEVERSRALEDGEPYD